MTILGQAARDKITGFEGIIASKVQYLNGCTRYGLQSKILHEGKPIDLEYFDEGQLDIIEGGVDRHQFTATRLQGGPRQNPPRF